MKKRIKSSLLTIDDEFKDDSHEVLMTFFELCKNEGILRDTKAINNKLKAIDDQIFSKIKLTKWELAKSFFPEFPYFVAQKLSKMFSLSR